MRQLLLLRHAKSSWDDPGLADRDRPLAARGRRAAKLISAHLSQAAVAPDLVLCSAARRTRETLERIAPALAPDVPVVVEQELYGASGAALLERLRAVEDGIGSAMLIAHNPGVQDLALTLAGSGDELATIERKYPTAALATLEFAGGWGELAPGSAALTDFVTPKQLAGR